MFERGFQAPKLFAPQSFVVDLVPTRTVTGQMEVS